MNLDGLPRCPFSTRRSGRVDAAHVVATIPPTVIGARRQWAASPAMLGPDLPPVGAKLTLLSLELVEHAEGRGAPVGAGAGA